MDSIPSLLLDDGIIVRPASSVTDYRACQDAQRQAWGISEDGYLIPIATMVGAQHHGGLVLGAFRPDGSAAAMSFAFLGRIDGRICLYSQLTGVVPGSQSLGLGYQMKLFQRRFALAEKIATIAWAFDPLQAGNARFNLQKLGATASRFVENMYGERTDRLNLNVPTDRIIAEWPVQQIESTRSSDQTGEDLATLIRIEPRSDGKPVPVSVDPAFSSSILRLPIPEDIGVLRRDDPALAETWRIAVKDAFQGAFAAGYRAVGFHRLLDPAGPGRAWYILERAGQ